MLCVICHDGIGTGEGKVFECGHVFHGECVDNWFQTNEHATCPQCRKVVDPTSARTLYVAIESPQPRSGASYRDQSSVIASQFKRIEELSNEKEKMEKVFDDKNKQLQALQKEMQDHYKKYQSLLEEKDDLENICNELYSKLAEIEVLKRSSSTIKAGCACVQAELDNLLVICGASTLRRPRDASLNNGELAGVSSACCTRRSSAVKESVIGNAANGAAAVISTSQNTAAASRQSASTVTRSTVASRSRATAATSRPRFITSTRSSAAREAAAPVASRSQVAASRPQVAASRPQVAASRPQVAASRPQVAASRPLAIEPRPSAVSHLYMSADILSAAAAEHSRRTSGGRPSSDVIQPPDSRRSPLASLSTTHGLPSSSYSRPALRSVDNAAATRRSERLVTRPR